MRKYFLPQAANNSSRSAYGRDQLKMMPGCPILYPHGIGRLRDRIHVKNIHTPSGSSSVHVVYLHIAAVAACSSAQLQRLYSIKKQSMTPGGALRVGYYCGLPRQQQPLGTLVPVRFWQQLAPHQVPRIYHRNGGLFISCEVAHDWNLE